MSGLVPPASAETARRALARVGVVSDRLSAHLLRRFDTRAWRMGAVDYLTAVGDATTDLAAAGRLPPTPWDEPLRDAVLTHRRVVYEEQVVHDLPADLM